jgi:YHS domain-containing protein
MKLHKILGAAAIAALLVTTTIQAQGEKRAQRNDKHEQPADAGKKDEKKPEASDRSANMMQRLSYPLTICVISGEKLDEKATEFVVKGQLFRTCCTKCQAQIEKDPTAALKKISDAVIAAQKAAYPLTTCVVTDAKLDDKAIDYVYASRLVRLANRDAVATFEKDPKAAMAKLDAAYIKALGATYALKKCPVSGEELGGMGSPVDKLYGTTLVRFCCNSCVKTFEKEPEKYLKEMAAAGKPAK